MLAQAMPASRGKSLTEEQNERVRAAVQALLPRFNNNRTALAKHLGVSQPVMSLFLNENTGAGFQFAFAVAQELGITLDELLSGKRGGETDSRPILANLPGWADAEAVARVKYKHQAAAFAFRLAREARGLAAPEVVTPEFVRDVAVLVQRYATDTDRDKASAVEMEAEIAADELAHREAMKAAKPRRGKP